MSNQQELTVFFIVLVILVLAAVLPKDKPAVKVKASLIPMCPYYRTLSYLEKRIYCQLWATQRDNLIYDALITQLGKNTKDGLYECIDYIYSQGCDNPDVMINAVGEDIWNLVKKLKEQDNLQAANLSLIKQ